MPRHDRPITLDDLRRFAVARSLFPPLPLPRALDRLGFVQADPIRAPARAQDLTLRHRVREYRAGDLERRYPRLDVEEDVFINYGFVSSTVHALMHPREDPAGWPAPRRRRAQAVLAFVRERGEVHPREVGLQFAHGTIVNYWGGSSNATTHLLEAMHYRGLLRVTRRERGVRIYAARDVAGHGEIPGAPCDRVDALVDVLLGKYAPVPAASLAPLVGRLRYAVPQWRHELKGALQRVKHRAARAQVDGADWYWPAGEDPRRSGVEDDVRLLAPFDPVVWDRRRFERLWGWAYRFEAYTPAVKRKMGHYALPLLWRDRVIGWATIAVVHGAIAPDVGYVVCRPPDRAFARALEAELERLREFLNLA